MIEPNLVVNVLPFKWPNQKIPFYFSDDAMFGTKLHESLFPNDIKSIFPSIKKNGDTFISTKFTKERDDYKKLDIDFKTENQNLIKRYYNKLILQYFSYTLGLPVKIDFIKDNQIWIIYAEHDTYAIYDKFTLKIQFCTMTEYPELLVTYDGQSKVSNLNFSELIQDLVPPSAVNWMINENQLIRHSYITPEKDFDLTKCFPVYNKGICIALGLPLTAPSKENKYIKYVNKINSFKEKYLNQPEFKDIIPIDSNFLNVDPSLVGHTTPKSEDLLFGNKTIGRTPKYDFKKNKPFRPSPSKSIHLFFIYYENDFADVSDINDHLSKGLNWFKGLSGFANLHVHTEPGFSIQIPDYNNPISFIETALENRTFLSDVTYIAVYISPFGSFESNKSKREIYFKLKETLLRRRIISQVIDINKMRESRSTGWIYSLTNIAVAMLAKLDGIPWILNAEQNNELVVGVGAFLNVESGVRYVGTAFSFSNKGVFKRFEYFIKDNTDLLAGSIADAVQEYVKQNNSITKLVIHFYKKMSEKDLLPIMEKLENLQLGVQIPIFIVSINKTESEDIIGYDTAWDKLMPYSGTYIKIGYHRYLLFNNTRYRDIPFDTSDSILLPIKLKIQCSDPSKLEDPNTIQGLIDQVYQFSRLYWKSLKHQNLPVTIKYPELLAQIAPRFDGNTVPLFGQDKLWFL
jgi:hypothetical protein